MSDADCTPGREPRSVAASYSLGLIRLSCWSVLVNPHRLLLLSLQLDLRFRCKHVVLKCSMVLRRVANKQTNNDENITSLADMMCCMEKWFRPAEGKYCTHCSLLHIMSNFPAVTLLCCRTALFIKSCLESDSPIVSVLLFVVVFTVVVWTLIWVAMLSFVTDIQSVTIGIWSHIMTRISPPNLEPQCCFHLSYCMFVREGARTCTNPAGPVLGLAGPDFSLVRRILGWADCVTWRLFEIWCWRSTLLFRVLVTRWVFRPHRSTT